MTKKRSMLYGFFAEKEGLVFALESAHAGAEALKLAREYSSNKAIVVNMSGRGDKDLFILAQQIDPDNWNTFLRKESQDGDT